MASSTGKQIVTTHILSNISRSEEDEAMKFGQLKDRRVTRHFSGQGRFVKIRAL